MSICRDQMLPTPCIEGIILPLSEGVILTKKLVVLRYVDKFLIYSVGLHTHFHAGSRMF